MKRLMLMAMAAALSGCGFRGGDPDGSGTIECTQVQVAPQVGGKIESLPVQEGDRVKKGALVARIDAADYQLKKDEAAAGLAQAQAQLDMMLAGNRDEDVRRAREELRQAAAMADAAAADLKRVEAVFEKGSATQKQMDDTRAAADRTAAARAAAEQNLQKVMRGARKEEIRMAEAQADVAKARLAQAEKAVGYCQVAAPMDGVVTTRNHEEGEVVGAGAALVTLSRMDEVWLSVYVPESRLGGVKVGQAARVRIDGDKKAYPGAISFVSPQAEFTPRNVQTPDERAKLVYRVKITLKNPDGIFKPGMPADGYLEGK